jgi:predicted alpha/beta superfamily hydrolase
MKNLSFLIGFLLFLVSCNKNLEMLDASLTKDFLMFSPEKNKDYRMWVQLPEGYDETKKYATIYVLDPDDKAEGGNSNFTYVAKLCQKMSTDMSKPNVIVVGIRHGDYREVDYTPTKYSTTGFSGEGGGEQFANFIKKDLIPRIEKDFRADTSREKRAIIGHSLGGLCGAYLFTKHNEAFGNYLLLSPSLIYDNEIILQYEQETRAAIQSKKQLVYLGLGGTEPNMVPPADLLQQRLQKYYTDAQSELYINPGKGHNSSKDENIQNALEFYFKNAQ